MNGGGQGYEKLCQDDGIGRNVGSSRIGAGLSDRDRYQDWAASSPQGGARFAAQTGPRIHMD